MNVLIACEESQVVCKSFRERGHQAYSCDIIDCSGGHLKCEKARIDIYTFLQVARQKKGT